MGGGGVMRRGRRKGGERVCHTRCEEESISEWYRIPVILRLLLALYRHANMWCETTVMDCWCYTLYIKHTVFMYNAPLYWCYVPYNTLYKVLLSLLTKQTTLY